MKKYLSFLQKRGNRSEITASYFVSGPTVVEARIDNLRAQVKKRDWLIFILALSLFFVCFLHLKTTVFQQRDLVVLHDSGNGVAWVTQERGRVKPSQAATQANIANYVRLRESYAANSFSHQYREVNNQSTQHIGLQYRQQWSARNPHSLLRRLSRSGIRKIKINDVILLPFSATQHLTKNKGKNPFAEVHFTSVEMTPHGSTTQVKNHIALISWQYSGIPSDPAERLTNWMGFRVYYYEVTDQ